MRRTRSTRSMISLESSTPTLYPSQLTQPTGSPETQAKATAWKPGDDCAAITTTRRPCDAWPILQQVQNPPRCQRVQDLGTALEDWLLKKRQYEMFTDRNGRFCQASDDSLVAAMFRLLPKSLEETAHVRQRGRGLPGVVRQTAGLQQHEAVNPKEVRARKPQRRMIRGTSMH